MIEHMEKNHINGTMESNGTIELNEVRNRALQVTHTVALTIMAMRDPMDYLVREGLSPEKITMIRFGTVLRAIVEEAEIAKLTSSHDDEIRSLCTAIATNIGRLMGIPSQVALEIGDSLADQIISNPESF